jgi:hypothetical protein
VIFSGGKLEFRKGQDIMVAAFKRFHARHPDSMLMVAWQNFWHKTIDGIEQTGYGSLCLCVCCVAVGADGRRRRYCQGKPTWTTDGVLLIEKWLIEENGLPPCAAPHPPAPALTRC